MLAGRFAASGRPGARLLLDGVPHQRGTLSGALIATAGLAALECEAEQRLEAGDHLLVIARVLDVPYMAQTGQPLIRFRGRHPPLAPPSPTILETERYQPNPVHNSSQVPGLPSPPLHTTAHNG